MTTRVVLFDDGFGSSTDPTNLVQGVIPEWATGVDYEVDDTIRETDTIYYCITAHTSGATFAGDSAYWTQTTDKAHRDNVSNPHSVTKDQVGLGNVTNVDHASALSTHEADTSTHGVGEILGTTETQNVSGKTVTDDQSFTSTGAIKVPVGTTLERPSGAAGKFRYNSTTGEFEGYTDAWGSIGGGGLTPVYMDEGDTGATLEAGNHYFFNLAGATADVSVTNEEGALESQIAITVFGIEDQTSYATTPYYLLVAADGSEDFWLAGDTGTTLDNLGESASSIVMTWDSVYNWVTTAYDLFTPNSFAGILDLEDGLRFPNGGNDILEDYEVEIVDVSSSGDFDAGNASVKCVRIGDKVTITSTALISHTAGVSANSATGLIPTRFRPSSDVYNIYYSGGSAIRRVKIDSDGSIGFQYVNYSGVGVSQSSTAVTISISYVIT